MNKARHLSSFCAVSTWSRHGRQAPSWALSGSDIAMHFESPSTGVDAVFRHAWKLTLAERTGEGWARLEKSLGYIASGVR
jgi:hypothetical protein